MEPSDKVRGARNSTHLDLREVCGHPHTSLSPLGATDVSPIPSPNSSTSPKNSGIKEKRGLLRRVVSLVLSPGVGRSATSPAARLPTPEPPESNNNNNHHCGSGSSDAVVSLSPEENNNNWTQDGGYVRYTKELGSGSFGTVYRGRCVGVTSALTAVAIKIYDKPKSRSSDADVAFRHFATERSALFALQQGGMGHPNIITMLDVYRVDGVPRIVLEYCEISLLDVLRLDELTPEFDENDAREAMRHCLAGLRYAHSLGVYNCDLKLENLLFVKSPVVPLERGQRSRPSPRGCCEGCDNSVSSFRLLRENLSSLRIIDWGFAMIAGPQVGLPGPLRNDGNGSEHYSAPEVGQGRYFDPALADMWSFGVCLYACLARRLPWTLNSTDPIRAARSREEKTMGIYPMIQHASPNAHRLLDRLLAPIPEDRLTCDRVSRHEWFTLTPRKVTTPISNTTVEKRPTVKCIP